MSLNVSLPPELENRVRQHVESGLYSSASEVIREALRLFEAYQGVQAANLASLKADIAQGVADIEAGRVRELDMNEIKQRGRATLAARRPAQLADVDALRSVLFRRGRWDHRCAGPAPRAGCPRDLELAKALRTRGKRHAVQSADLAQALGWPLAADRRKQASSIMQTRSIASLMAARRTAR